MSLWISIVENDCERLRSPAELGVSQDGLKTHIG